MRKESSTNFENETTLMNFCNASKTLLLINGRWKMSMLFALLENEKRTFSDFKTLLPQISDRMLALKLNELVEDRIITKEKNGNSFCYELTTKGRALKSILQSLAEFTAHPHQ